MGAEVADQFLDKKVAHIWVHLQVKYYMAAKLLILIGKSTCLDFRVTDSCSYLKYF